MSLPVTLIAAVAENGVIGQGNAIPWRLPSDFAHFKRETLGKPLIMGRRTFESIGRPLPGRTNIVVSRQPGYQPDGVIVIDSLDAALAHAETIALADGAGEIMIGGGAEIYRQAMPRADRLLISWVALNPEGDTWFPEIDPAVFETHLSQQMPQGPKDTASFRVTQYRRREGT